LECRCVVQQTRKEMALQWCRIEIVCNLFHTNNSLKYAGELAGSAKYVL
jgi:hypothetical protein